MENEKSWIYQKNNASAKLWLRHKGFKLYVWRHRRTPCRRGLSWPFAIRCRGMNSLANGQKLFAFSLTIEKSFFQDVRAPWRISTVDPLTLFPLEVNFSRDLFWQVQRKRLLRDTRNGKFLQAFTTRSFPSKTFISSNRQYFLTQGLYIACSALCKHSWFFWKRKIWINQNILG